MEDSSRKKVALINPHFFQPLLPDFQSNFSIPKSFLKYIGGGGDIKEADEKISILRNYRVKPEDDYWFVKVCYFDDKVHFKDGWEKFCEDHGLQVGDILVFQHHQNMVFDVIVFDPTACERPFPGIHHPTTTKMKSFSLNNPEKKGFCKNGKAKVTFEPRGLPYCHTFVQSYCLTWGGMPLPTKFARENGLANKCCNMKLKDQIGKEWPVLLRNNRQGRSVYIGKWRDFHRKHGLKTGDHVIFELVELGHTPKMNFYKLS